MADLMFGSIAEDGSLVLSTAAAGSHLLDRPMTTKHTEKTPLGKRSPAKDNASEVLGDRHAQAVAAAAAKNGGEACDKTMLDPGQKARVPGHWYIVQLKPSSREVMHDEGGQAGDWVVKQVGGGVSHHFRCTAGQKAEKIAAVQADRVRGLKRDRTHGAEQARARAGSGVWGLGKARMSHCANHRVQEVDGFRCAQDCAHQKSSVLGGVGEVDDLDDEDSAIMQENNTLDLATSAEIDNKCVLCYATDTKQLHKLRLYKQALVSRDIVVALKQQLSDAIILREFTLTHNFKVKGQQVRDDIWVEFQGVSVSIDIVEAPFTTGLYHFDTEMFKKRDAARVDFCGVQRGLHHGALTLTSSLLQRSRTANRYHHSISL